MFPLVAHRVEMGMPAIALLIGAKRTCAVEGPDSAWRALRRGAAGSATCPRSRRHQCWRASAAEAHEQVRTNP
jgi:hypothetical protein